MKDKILVLSNNKENLALYSRYAKSNAWDVHQTNVSADAFFYVKTNIIQCILVDETLSDCDLFVFLKKMEKTTPHHHKMPIIVLGETGSEKNIIAILKAGATDYFLKTDLNPKQLQKTIKSVIEKNALLQKIRVQEAEMRRLAMYDYITNIPNRRQFEELAQKALSRAKRYKKSFAIIIIDIDYFKNINDTLGQEAGDILLKKLMQRFSLITRKNDHISRLGGDEFAIILDLIKNPEESIDVAKRILDSMEEPFVIYPNSEHIISVSIGVATYPTAGNTVSELIKNADSALYQAKSSGRNTFRDYSKEFNYLFSEYLTIENAARDALKKNEFYLVFQPIFNAKDNSLFGYETLLRWRNERLKNYTPSQLIPIVEESGFILQLGDWILETAFMKFSALKNPNVHLSINLSPRQLANNDFIDNTKRLLKKYNINPEHIIFELTETAIISDTKNTNKLLQKLVDLKCRIFIDDFGTGYSSLSSIRQLPISGLKIDKVFIDGIEKNIDDLNMVKSIFVLASNMNLTVIAEGVENAHQLAILITLNSPKVQGYFLGEPSESMK